MTPPSSTPPSEMRWDDLQVFLAAYRTRSLTAAAEQLGLHQSTTSRRVAALEAALGERLFDRTPEGLVPAALAERILGAAERAEVAAHEVARLGAGASEDVAGEVRVAMAVGMSAFAFAPRAPELLARHPRLRLSLTVSASLADLTRREADLAVRFVRPTRGDLVAKRVHAGPYGLYAGPALRERLGPGPHALEEVPFVGWDPEQSFGEARWEREAGLRMVARADELTTRVALARAGVGAIALADGFARFVPGLARLELVRAPPLEAEVYLVTHRALRDVPRVRAVWDFLEAQIAALAGPRADR